MKKPTGMPSALLIALLVGCAGPAQETQKADEVAIEAEVKAWLSDFWATWNEGGEGFDRAVALFHDEAPFILASEGKIWRSHAAWVEAFRPGLENIRHQGHDMEEPDITVLTEDLVYVAQRGDWSATFMDGTASDTIPFAQTMLLERSDGGWKVRFGHESF